MLAIVRRWRGITAALTSRSLLQAVRASGLRTSSADPTTELTSFAPQGSAGRAHGGRHARPASAPLAPTPGAWGRGREGNAGAPRDAPVGAVRVGAGNWKPENLKTWRPGAA